MNYNPKFPAISDLKLRAKKRIPNFAFDYVDTGIDEEHGKQRNRDAWNEILMTPRYLRDVSQADLSTRLFSNTDSAAGDSHSYQYSLPFGVPPIGLGNMMWPGAELALARAAQQANIPYTLSTFSTTKLEKIAQVAPDVCWFQLYVPKKVEVMKDLIARIKRANYQVLVVTLDIPVGAKRNRELKRGLTLPFRLTPSIISQCIQNPSWTLNTLAHGAPKFVNVTRYQESKNQGLSQFITSFNMHGVTRERIEMIRKLWDRPLVLKGIQHPEDMRAAVEIGVDGIIISNHGGRQLDAAPSSAHSLQAVPAEIRKQTCVMVDSGIRTGLDIVRAKALGAQMAFSGRSFFWGIGALGKSGANQVVQIFHDEVARTLKQLGCESFVQMDKSWLANDVT